MVTEDLNILADRNDNYRLIWLESVSAEVQVIITLRDMIAERISTGEAEVFFKILDERAETLLAKLSRDIEEEGPFSTGFLKRMIDETECSDEAPKFIERYAA